MPEKKGKLVFNPKKTGWGGHWLQIRLSFLPFLSKLLIFVFGYSSHKLSFFKIVANMMKIIEICHMIWGTGNGRSFFGHCIQV